MLKTSRGFHLYSSWTLPALKKNGFLNSWACTTDISETCMCHVYEYRETIYSKGEIKMCLCSLAYTSSPQGWVRKLSVQELRSLPLPLMKPHETFLSGNKFVEKYSACHISLLILTSESIFWHMWQLIFQRCESLCLRADARHGCNFACCMSWYIDEKVVFF